MKQPKYKVGDEVVITGHPDGPMVGLDRRYTYFKNGRAVYAKIMDTYIGDVMTIIDVYESDLGFYKYTLKDSSGTVNTCYWIEEWFELAIVSFDTINAQVDALL